MDATRHASHRRDHHHDVGKPMCRPHDVEVIDLGTHAFSVCHCCGFEGPTGSHHEAEATAERHRHTVA